MGSSPHRRGHHRPVRAMVVDHAPVHGVLRVVVAGDASGSAGTIVAEPGHRAHRVRERRARYAGSRRAEHRRAEQHGVGFRGHRDRDPERVGVRLQPRRGSRRCRRTRRAGRPCGPASASASTMWRVAYASACSAARYQHARSSTSSRMRTPAVPPVSVGSASGARLPSTFGCQCRSAASSSSRRRPGRASRARRSSVGERIGAERGRARDAPRARGRGTRPTPRCRLRCSHASGSNASVVRTPDAADVVALRRHREVARRRSGDDREAPVERSVVACGAEHAERAGVRVDERHADRRARRDAERRRPRPASRRADALARARARACRCARSRRRRGRRGRSPRSTTRSHRRSWPR